MRTRIFILLYFLISFGTYGQAKQDQYLGINILQLPALTININYSAEINPFFTPVVDIGYTFNYVKAAKFDWTGRLITSHREPEYEYPYRVQWCAYDLYIQSGGYFKFGGYFNFRRDIEKKHFAHVGVFQTNSIVYESGDMYILYPVTFLEPTAVNHMVIICGLNVAAGYEFSIANRVKSNIDFQISMPNKNYKYLYEYRNFIPGMGFKDNESRLYPMLIWNLKYRL